MLDTGEDIEIVHDTNPMSRPIHLWSHWRVQAEELAPELVVWYVSDGGELKIPTRSEHHAALLCDAMQLAEYETAVVASALWVSLLRQLVLRAARWLNRVDRVHRPLHD